MARSWTNFSGLVIPILSRFVNNISVGDMKLSISRNTGFIPAKCKETDIDFQQKTLESESDCDLDSEIFVQRRRFCVHQKENQLICGGREFSLKIVQMFYKSTKNSLDFRSQGKRN